MAYDIIVLGSGPGGYVAAIRAAQLGFKTAVVERESLGGVCLNWGCIPTKALLKSAQVFNYLKNADQYGITVANPKADFTAVINRSRSVAEGMNKGIAFLLKKNKVDVFQGEGYLPKNGGVKVTDAKGKEQLYQAKHIIISVGARSRQLPNLVQDGEKIIGYREALTLKKQPKRMVVVGSGAIGLEFSYFYNSLGSEVSIIELMPKILPIEDDDVSLEMEMALKKQGIKIYKSSTITSIEKTKEGIKVKINTGKVEEVVEADLILSAVGISPNTENMGLEDLGITTEKGYIRVDGFCRTSVAGYYAIGDVIQTPALAHVASAEGILCVEKISGLPVDPINYENIPGAIYTSPEVASVGLTEKAAKEQGYSIKIGKFLFIASGKAKAEGHATGFVKVIFDEKYGEWLGCHMVGEGVTEMIAGVVAARNLETTAYEILKSVHPHPTMSEAIMEAVAAAYGEAIHI